MISLDPEDFPSLDSEQVAELEATARLMERAAARREARRNGRARKHATRLTPAEAEAVPYTRDPYWGTDDRGRFRYVDYDGESLHIRYEDDGDLWVDKKGEGPVYIRSEDIPVIIAALEVSERVPAEPKLTPLEQGYLQGRDLGRTQWP